jgi:hypothetical protein
MTGFNVSVDPLASIKQDLAFLNELHESWTTIAGEMNYIDPALRACEVIAKSLAPNVSSVVITQVNLAFANFRKSLEAHSTFQSSESLAKRKAVVLIGNTAKPAVAAVPVPAKPTAERKFRLLSNEGKLRIKAIIDNINSMLPKSKIKQETDQTSETTTASSRGAQASKPIGLEYLTMLPPVSVEFPAAVSHVTNWGVGASAVSVDKYVQHPKGVLYCNKANIEIDISYDEEESKKRGAPCYGLLIEGKKLRFPVMTDPKAKHIFSGSTKFTFDRLGVSIIKITEVDSQGAYEYFVDISQFDTTHFYVYVHLPQERSMAAASEALKTIPADHERIYAAYNKHGVIWFGYDSKTALRKCVLYWAPPGVKDVSKKESITEAFKPLLDPTLDQIGQTTEHVKVYSDPNVIFSVTSLVTQGSNLLPKRIITLSINGLHADLVL